ncbi:UDP-glucose dehydrogenase family protein [Sulfobacillus harzensis]|uniref:UDP-glucose 6-dehydrogenase n=1 Tax=Sulfobacillus harzensis TaxID=2729629 RepID=A0A7Y0L1Z3_9FIRM|nr:UDP-glucose/GDP-mannose dehydrogenase family protein [Sulfobacillus harzensis]NMP20865.1 UDP-glucose/GDP-mannose dehydrogenase family protein [Sulfobacillus harzensis]
MRVSVFGAGYVGLVTGAVLADLGHHVTLIEVSEEKIALINQRRSPIFEEGLESLLARSIDQGRLSITNDAESVVGSSEVIFIAVGTPPLPDGEADLRYVRQAALAIGRGMHGHPRQVIVNKATVPIGSANLVEVWVQDGYREVHGRAPSSEWYTVASNPEFLREGTAIFDTLYPDRIVLGADEAWAIDRLQELYRPILEQSFEPPPESPRPNGVTSVPVVVTDRISSEMIKYAANAFLATKISFANEIANISERVGADIVQVMRGIGLDQRIGGRFLNAGIGWGGSCFGKDMAALTVTAEEYGYQPRLLHATQDVNREQRLLVIKRLQEALKPVKGRRIAVWGVAFKPGTDDLRDAPSLTIIEELLRLGARVRVYDPIALDNLRRLRPDLEVEFADSAEDALDGADALILATEWPSFAEIPLATIADRLTRGIVIDGRNFWDPEAARQAGLQYRGIGR